MEEFNAIVNEILKETFTSVNPLRYGNVDGLYIGFNCRKKLVEFKNGNKKILYVPKGILGQTIANVEQKLFDRYLGEDPKTRENLTQDCMSEAITCVIQTLFKMYIGQIKISDSEIHIEKINSANLSEIKEILNNESKEEKEERIKNLIKLIKSDIGRATIYNTATNIDFDTNFKNNKMQCEIKVKYSKDENGKTILKYEPIFYNSISTPSRIDVNSSGFVDVDTIDYFYGKGNLTLAEKCADNVQQTDNSTKGMYGYIYNRYYDKLTDKQKTWFQYAIENSENGSNLSFIKKGDENYPSRNCRSFRSYMTDKIYNLIENDEESKLYITQNRQIAWKVMNQTSDKIKAILMQQCKETQIDMLISTLNKDNKTSEMITEHLLDNNLYRPVCDVITGKISKYKFKVVYLSKVLNSLERLI